MQIEAEFNYSIKLFNDIIPFPVNYTGIYFNHLESCNFSGILGHKLIITLELLILEYAKFNFI